MLLFAIGHDELDFKLFKIDALGEVFARVERAPELFKLPIVLGQLDGAGF